MKAAIYCRVSTDDQEKEGTSLKTQLEACLKYCQEKGYTVVRKFSEAYSGLKLDRPKLTELRNMVLAHDLDCIIVYCLDRLSRDPAHGAMLFQQLEENHVTLEAVTETIENTDMGKLISYIRGFGSKVEAEKIRERTMRGKLAHLKEGKLPQGTGIGIYGYKWDKATGRRTIIEHESKIVQKIFTKVLEGSSFNKIAIELNKASIFTKAGKLWHPLTVKRIATNPTYTGHTNYGMTKRIGKKVVIQPKENWILLPDITPPIITEETFKRTQEAIKQARLSRPVRPSGTYLLTGFIRCNKCGSTICGTTLSKKYRYYKCRGSNPTTTRDKICNVGYIRADHIEEFVWKHISKDVRDPHAVLRALDNIEKSGSKNILQSLEKRINQLKKSLKFYSTRIPECYDILKQEDEYKDKLLDIINDLKKNRTRDELQLKQSQESYKKINQAQQVKIKFTEQCRNIRKLYSGNISVEKKREVLSLFETEVLACPGHYTLATSLSAEIVSKHDTLLQSSLIDENLVTIEQTSGCLHVLKDRVNDCCLAFHCSWERIH